MKTMKIGSEKWWLKEQLHGSHGIVNAIVFLVANHKISILKGVELIECLMTCRKKGIPPAPWEEVAFGGSFPEDSPCAQEMEMKKA